MHWLRDSFESIALDLGDCIGLESCVDLKTDIDELFCMVQRSRNGGGVGGRSDQRLEKIEREYPPPMPWLARTENLPSHMPWIMRRYYSNDGRLIIMEEKVKRHEYFQAHRSNGRLTLQLVPLNHEVLDDDHNEEEAEECDQIIDVRASERDCCDGEREDQTVVEEESRINKLDCCLNNGRDVIGHDRGGGGGGGGRGQCYRYGSMSRNSCMFGMAVAAVRPVHT